MDGIRISRCSSHIWRRSWTVVWLLGLALHFVLMVDNPSVHAQQPKAVYWKQRLFYIPYQVNRPQRALNPVRKVQLLISRDGVSNWQVLQEAEPQVQGFSYNAPEDGEYWFALRHIDRRGQPWPTATVTPQMRIIIDTAGPELTLSGTLDAAGSIVLHYEATDRSLNVDTLHLEARPEGGSWVSLTPGLHDVSHPDRLMGRVRWQLPSGAPSVEVRGSISDRAGHKGETVETIKLTGPELVKPNLASSPRAWPDAVQRQASAPSQEWPTTNRVMPQQSEPSPTAQQFAGASVQTPPPIYNPYTTSSANREQQNASPRTPARLIGEGIPSVSKQTEDPFKTDSTGPTAPQAPADEYGWQSASSAGVNAVRAVSSRTFEVDYNLESVGPWGISKVELWGTHDGGSTWQSYGVDNDNRSPLRVTVPDSGRYGFRILVDGVSGVGSPAPRPGDKPELVVDVDLQAPAAEILDVQPQQGDLAGHLSIRWTANDSNLEDRPVSLYYGSYANGPWSAIATQLPNNGSYTWRMERHLPERFFVRLEVRDQAGNITARETPTPITINRTQPTGTLRGVRPVESDRWQNETAQR